MFWFTIAMLSRKSWSQYLVCVIFAVCVASSAAFTFGLSGLTGSRLHAEASGSKLSIMRNPLGVSMGLEFNSFGFNQQRDLFDDLLTYRSVQVHFCWASNLLSMG
jgi:hypothetical protein